MRFFRTIFIIIVICIAIIILWRVGQSSVSMHVVPSLSEYVASSTREQNGTSTEQTTSVWMASSTIVNMLLSDTSGTSTATVVHDVGTLPSTTPLLPAKKPTTSIVSARSTLLDGYLKAPKGTIRLLIAKNPSSREHGLSGYESLPADQGMLFIFPRAGSVSFWMKDMKFPLDIVWIASNGKILGVTENISPKTYPKSFVSPGDVQFVLELNANTATAFGLRKGVALSF